MMHLIFIISGLHIAVASVFVILFSLLDISFFVLMGFILQDFTKGKKLSKI